MPRNARPARDHVERRDDLGEDRGIAVGDAGDERAELDALGARRERAEQRVGLEHLVVGRAEQGQLVEVVHHHHGVEAGLPRRSTAIVADSFEEVCRGDAGIGEVRDLQSGTNHGCVVSVSGPRCVGSSGRAAGSTPSTFRFAKMGRWLTRMDRSSARNAAHGMTEGVRRCRVCANLLDIEAPEQRKGLALSLGEIQAYANARAARRGTGNPHRRPHRVRHAGCRAHRVRLTNGPPPPAGSRGRPPAGRPVRARPRAWRSSSTCRVSSPYALPDDEMDG